MSHGWNGWSRTGGPTWGGAVTLTNDPGYWRPAAKTDPIDVSYRLHEGRMLTGTLGWAARAAAGTTKRREAPLVLTGTYDCVWRDYSTVVDARGRQAAFRYLGLVVADGLRAIP
jgi:hypothetical protein